VGQGDHRDPVHRMVDSRFMWFLDDPSIS